MAQRQHDFYAALGLVGVDDAAVAAGVAAAVDHGLHGLALVQHEESLGVELVLRRPERLARRLHGAVQAGVVGLRLLVGGSQLFVARRSAAILFGEDAGETGADDLGGEVLALALDGGVPEWVLHN